MPMRQFRRLETREYFVLYRVLFPELPSAFHLENLCRTCFATFSKAITERILAMVKHARQHFGFTYARRHTEHAARLWKFNRVKPRELIISIPLPPAIVIAERYALEWNEATDGTLPDLDKS